jgi:hypothetical protein
VLLMTNGWSHAWHEAHARALPAPESRPMPAWPPHARFVPQKAQALRRARLLVMAAGVAGVLAIVAGLLWWTGA